MYWQFNNYRFIDLISLEIEHDEGFCLLFLRFVSTFLCDQACAKQYWLLSCVVNNATHCFTSIQTTAIQSVSFICIVHLLDCEVYSSPIS